MWEIMILNRDKNKTKQNKNSTASWRFPLWDYNLPSLKSDIIENLNLSQTIISRWMNWKVMMRRLWNSIAHSVETTTGERRFFFYSQQEKFSPIRNFKCKFHCVFYATFPANSGQIEKSERKIFLVCMEWSRSKVDSLNSMRWWCWWW